jgi:hypothetical protein
VLSVKSVCIFSAIQCILCFCFRGSRKGIRQVVYCKAWVSLCEITQTCEEAWLFHGKFMAGIQ